MRGGYASIYTVRCVFEMLSALFTPHMLITAMNCGNEVADESNVTEPQALIIELGDVSDNYAYFLLMRANKLLSRDHWLV